MSGEECFAYLIHVCDSIRNGCLELNNLYSHYLKFGISREFLNKEINFYGQIAVSFLSRIRENITDNDDDRNLIGVEYLLLRLFQYSTHSGENLFKEERDKLKTRLTVFTKEFYSNFMRTLKLYDPGAKFPSDSKQEEIKYFCNLRLGLINNVQASSLMLREIPLTILTSKLLNFFREKDSPLNTLVEEDRETLLSKERLLNTLELINTIFSS